MRVALALLAPLAARAVVVDWRHLRAFVGGYRCLSSRRCREGHTYRPGCLLRTPGGKR